jgi:16S rRNA U516 pseudouridylate synthase RsuA-like enzyme
MKTITINVSEPVYHDFRRASRSQGRPTSELIREAMESYRRQHLRARGDLRRFRPRSLGRVLKPLSRRDDLLSEMLDGES